MCAAPQLCALADAGTPSTLGVVALQSHWVLANTATELRREARQPVRILSMFAWGASALRQAARLLS